MALGASLGVVGLGILLRVCGFSMGLHEFMSWRPEFVTPLTSFNRLKEGIALSEMGVHPYAGDTFHQPPLLLPLFSSVHGLNAKAETRWSALVFTILDVLVALLLRRICAVWCARRAEAAPIPAGIDMSLPTMLTSRWLPDIISATYLLNPLSILACLSRSTASLETLTLCATVLLFSEGRPVLGSGALAVATYLSPHTLALAVPLFRLAMVSRPAGHGRGNSAGSTTLAVISACTFAVWIGALLYVSAVLLDRGAFLFLGETYGWALGLHDLSPNVGVFWYFFTEVFGRFRSYFLFLFHIHPYLYVAPLTIRFWTQPTALVGLCIAVFAVFKSYPSLADVSLPFALLCAQPRVVLLMRSLPLFLGGLSLVILLMPLMWHLWLYPSSGNSNYFYGVTLAYNGFASLLVLEFAAAVVKRDQLINTALRGKTEKGSGKALGERKAKE